VRILRHAEGGILGGGTHGELVQVRLTEKYGPFFLELRNDRCIIGGYIAFQDAGCCGRRAALHEHIVLDRERNAGERLEFRARCEGDIRRLRIAERQLLVQRKIRPDLFVGVPDVIEEPLRDLERGELLREEPFAEGGNGEVAEKGEGHGLGEC
jgi:hypothetical protein